MIYIKNRTEIEKMRVACKLAAEILTFIEPYVKPGVNTLLLNDLIHDFTLKKGAKSAPLNYKGFPKAICTSINDVVCHGIPKKEDVLKEGDIINIDVTPIVNGYHGDTSKTFCIGKISPALATAVVGLATAVATLISPEKATGATAGASFGSVLTALLPALSGVLANLPVKADEPLQQVPQEDPNDGGGDLPTGEKIKKNLPLILGGLALVGAGIYFYTKKK